MGNTVLTVQVIILLLAGILWLQISFSRKKSRYLGLIIPVLCFLCSVMSILGITMFSASTEETDMISKIIVNGNLTEMKTIQPQTQDFNINFGAVAAVAGLIFIIMNIPTAIFLAVYFMCREQGVKEQAVED